MLFLIPLLLLMGATLRQGRPDGVERKVWQVRFNTNEDAPEVRSIDAKSRPQTTSRGSMGGTPSDTGAGSLVGTHPRMINAQTGEQIDLKVAQAMATITGKPGAPNRRPPLASPKKKGLRQGSAGVRRGSPKKSARRALPRDNMSKPSNRPPISPVRSPHPSQPKVGVNDAAMANTGGAASLTEDNSGRSKN